jgi:hypothetical protein
MGFARCCNCGHVVWRLTGDHADDHPAGDCPECMWKMDWTTTPVSQKVAQRREEMREVLGRASRAA